MVVSLLRELESCAEILVGGKKSLLWPSAKDVVYRWNISN